MPGLKNHCAISKKRTGKSFKDLHEWMDIYREVLGENHRALRHFWSKKQQQGIKEYYDRQEIGLGKIAVEEWLFHIVLDNLSTLFKKVKNNRETKDRINVIIFGFEENGFIHHKQFNLTEEELQGLFKISDGDEQK